MASAFSTLQAMALETFKRTDKTTELKRAINDTYKEMIGCLNPRKQQDQIYRSTVASREEYPFPDAVIRISHPIRLIDVSASNNSSASFPLDFISKDEYDLREPNPNAATIVGGTPSAYTIFKNSILLTQIPNKVFRLEINIAQEATVLVADADQVIFIPTWDETIKAGALARLYGTVERWDMADYWQKVYRYGFAGDIGRITGGLELFRQLNNDVSNAPMIVKPTYF